MGSDPEPHQRGRLEQRCQRQGKGIICAFLSERKRWIFNLPYYDLLIGLDLTVFASYYEPWGYTPLESLAFSVPTVTTTLAGFGLWINNKCPDAADCIDVIERKDDNDEEVVRQYCKCHTEEMQT